MHITVYHYLSLYITIYHCISLYISLYIYHYISLYITVYHCISLYITVYHYISLYIISGLPDPNEKSFGRILQNLKNPATARKDSSFCEKSFRRKFRGWRRKILRKDFSRPCQPPRAVTGYFFAGPAGRGRGRLFLSRLETKNPSEGFFAARPAAQGRDRIFLSRGRPAWAVAGYFFRCWR